MVLRFAATVMILVSSRWLLGQTSLDAERAAPPSDEQVATARQTVRDLFKSEFDKATDSRARSQLATKMVDVARDTKTDLAGKYALLLIARDIAVLAADAKTALAAVDVLDESFVVDGAALRVETLQKIVRASGSALDPESLAQPWQAALRAAFRSENPELAKSCLTLGETFRRVKDRAARDRLMAELTAAASQLTEMQKMLIAKTALAASSNDAAANFSVGEYYCLVAQQWDAGLPFLAKSNHAALAAVAKQELDRPTADVEQLQLADALWAASESLAGGKQAALQRRAVYWYEQCLPKLGGLVQTRAQQRIDTVKKSATAAAVASTASRTKGKTGKTIEPAESAITERATLDAPLKSALDWLAAHQSPDGSWNFNHALVCGGRCSNPGNMADAPSASTAMAVLSFVHAGQTHREGEYKKVVERGLAALTSRAQPTAGGASYHERSATMYGHGLATLALCEAYARTKDDRVKNAAQAAVNFTISAQDPAGGGWRYTPRQAGDTSVTGWQLSGLQTATLAGLQVPAVAFRGADNFLNSVQADQGARYGYTGPGQGQATTAIGLLGRLQLGHKADEAAIVRGLEYVDRLGPSSTNLYYNLYATRLMRAAKGEHWEAWRAKMREQLLARQEKTGHAAGSFLTEADQGLDRGGRLYCTSLCALTYADVQDGAK